MQTITINDIKIEIKSENSLYITKGNWIVYMDDGVAGEKILSHWIDDEAFETVKISVIDY